MKNKTAVLLPAALLAFAVAAVSARADVVPCPRGDGESRWWAGPGRAHPVQKPEPAPLPEPPAAPGSEPPPAPAVPPSAGGGFPESSTP